MTGVETTTGHIRWYFTITRLYNIPASENVEAPRPPEKEILKELYISL